MLDRLKQQWAQLKDARPGCRFQEQYERRQKEQSSPVRKWAVVGLGLVVLAGGIVLLPAPGPGFLVVALGAALVAQESALASKAADGAEVRLRRVAAWGIRVWRRSSGPVRALIVLAALAVAGGAGWVGYRVMFAG